RYGTHRRALRSPRRFPRPRGIHSRDASPASGDDRAGVDRGLSPARPASQGASAVREFVKARGLGVWFLNEAALGRAFELMSRYADHPMDLADASLVATAEALKTTRVFTLDRNDFATYRAMIGRTSRRFSVIG